MMLFNKDQLGEDIIETAISSLHLEDHDYSQPFKEFIPGENKQEASAKVETFFKNEAITLDEGINRLLASKIDPEPEIMLDWVQIDNKVPFTADNAYIRTLKKNNSHLIERSLIAQKCEKKLLYGILIKQHQGSSMPKVNLDYSGIQ